MKKTVISCFMKLPDELILHITSFIDDFHKIQLSYASKHLHSLVYRSKLQHNVKQYLFNLKYMKNECFKYIKKINTDGVINGECEQCFRIQLLYTYNDGITEKCICLNNCKMNCFNCRKDVTFRYLEKGCPNCYQDLSFHHYFLYRYF